MADSERDVLRERIGAVIDRWYHLGLIRFGSRDDGGDDLILRDELVATALAAQPSAEPEPCPHRFQNGPGDPWQPCTLTTDHDDDHVWAAQPSAESLEKSGDLFPNGYGCQQCDGTGFMPQSEIDRLRALGYRVPWSDYPEGTPHLDPESEIGLAVAADEAKRVALAADRPTPGEHVHNWVDARNEVVTSGEVCPDCGAIRPTPGPVGETEP